MTESKSRKPKTTEAKKKTKSNSGQFKKGNKAGTGYGRPTMTPEQKALALASRTQFKTVLTQYSTLTLREIKKLLKSANVPVLELAVLRHLKELAENGSMDRADWTLDHMLGKVNTTTNLNLSGGLDNTNAINLKDCTKEELLLLKKLAEKKGKK